MPKPAKHLLIGSTHAYSGKSATVLGLSYLLQHKGVEIAYGKPIGTFLNTSADTMVDEDVQFIAASLNLPANRVAPTLLNLNEQTLHQRLGGTDKTNYQHALTQEYSQIPNSDLVLLEGGGDLEEGLVFDLSLNQIATNLNAAVLLVARHQSLLAVDALLSAKQRLGDNLIGVVINDVPDNKIPDIEENLCPFLEEIGIPVLGILPESELLRSVSVRELVHQLNAEVLCRSDRLDLMVESLAIGAMNVNSAVKYFRKRRNMAVVTGGDRIEIQQAALETSTQCLILTGKLPPPAFILHRAEELEIPILSVDLDTLSTVEIVDHTFGQVRVHEPVKVQCIRHLMAKHFDINRLLTLLDLNPAAVP